MDSPLRHASRACTHHPVLQNLLERLSTHLVHAPKSTLSTEDGWGAALEEHELLVRAIAREHTETAPRAASSSRPSCGRHRPGASSGAVRGLGIDESVGAS
ncbi:MAG TPA: FCD domain-containing protein [Propionicimonas sp.]|nr:FCD domain-containing protein [Propionicimonas sp.]